MPLHQLLHLLRVPHDAVRPPWVFEEDDLPNHEGIMARRLPRLRFYSACFRAGALSHAQRSAPDSSALACRESFAAEPGSSAR